MGKAQNNAPKKKIPEKGQRKRARRSVSPSRKVEVSPSHPSEEKDGLDQTSLKNSTSKLLSKQVLEGRKAAPSLPAKPTTGATLKQATLYSAQRRAPGQSDGSDVLLSLANPRYKQIMFAKYQMLGVRKDGGENENLLKVRDWLFSFFKKEMGENGRFLKSDRYMNNIQEIDDKDALEKIKMDLKRRNESSKHWLK